MKLAHNLCTYFPDSSELAMQYGQKNNSTPTFFPGFQSPKGNSWNSALI